MDKERIAQYGDELFKALQTRTVIEPLTTRDPTITIEDAYHIARRMVDRRVEQGERIVGKKIGVTSAPVQNMLSVHQPDFGWLTDAMIHEDGAEISIAAQLIQPRAEGELAFRLGARLEGPGVTGEDVLRATATVAPCFEIVDSRVRDWAIKIQDTVADNASSGVFVLGPETAPGDLDLAACLMVVRKNGVEISRGTGTTALTGQPRLGTPANCVAWLANTLAEFGIALEAGEIILSGSLVPLEPVAAGDTMELTVNGLGAVSVAFV